MRDTAGGGDWTQRLLLFFFVLKIQRLDLFFTRNRQGHDHLSINQSIYVSIYLSILVTHLSLCHHKLYSLFFYYDYYYYIGIWPIDRTATHTNLNAYNIMNKNNITIHFRQGK